MLSNEDWCIATITLARTEEEETLLRTSLPLLSRFDVPVFVADGGSPEDFLRFVRDLPNVTLLLPNAKGLWAQAKTSLQGAATTKAPFILYTEPDKKDFFASGVDGFLAQAEAAPKTGVVMAARTAEAFASFPAFQQMTETAINQCCKEVMGLDADYCYGPFLLKKDLAASLNALPDDIGWGWRPAAFATAHRQGYAVKTVEGSFFCPQTQRDDDASERIYRMKQLEQNIRGLVLSATFS